MYVLILIAYECGLWNLLQNQTKFNGNVVLKIEEYFLLFLSPSVKKNLLTFYWPI